MGQEQSVITISECDSAAFESRAVTTNPLDELCDYERLWKEIQEGIRTDFSKDPAVTSFETIEKSATEFEIIRKYDAAALKIPAPPGTEIASRSVFQIDKDKGEIYEEIRSVLDIVEEVYVMKTLKSPLHMEMVAQRVLADPAVWRCGPRVSGQLAEIMKRVTKRDDIQLAAQKSRLPSSGHVVATQSLGDVISFADLCEGLMEQFRTQAYNTFAKEGSVEVKEVSKDDSKTIFDVFCTVDGAKVVEAQLAKEAQDFKTRARVEANSLKDPEKKDLPPEEQTVLFAVHVYTARAETHLLIDVLHLVVHRHPELVVECWATSPIPYYLPLPMDPTQLFFGLKTGDNFSKWCKALALRLGK